MRDKNAKKPNGYAFLSDSAFENKNNILSKKQNNKRRISNAQQKMIDDLCKKLELLIKDYNQDDFDTILSKPINNNSVFKTNKHEYVYKEIIKESKILKTLLHSQGMNKPNTKQLAEKLAEIFTFVENIEKQNDVILDLNYKQFGSQSKLSSSLQGNRKRPK